MKRRWSTHDSSGLLEVDPVLEVLAEVVAHEGTHRHRIVHHALACNIHDYSYSPAHRIMNTRNTTKEHIIKMVLGLANWNSKRVECFCRFLFGAHHLWHLAGSTPSRCISFFAHGAKRIIQCPYPCAPRPQWSPTWGTRRCRYRASTSSSRTREGLPLKFPFWLFHSFLLVLTIRHAVIYSLCIPSRTSDRQENMQNKESGTPICHQ